MWRCVDSMGLHRVENASHTSPAVSLHLYSPPFQSCQSFDQRTGMARTVKMTFWSKHGLRTSSADVSGIGSQDRRKGVSDRWTVKRGLDIGFELTLALTLIGFVPCGLVNITTVDSGVCRNLKRGDRGKFQVTHCQKCSNFSIIFFTLKISSTFFSPLRRMGPPLNTPLTVDHIPHQLTSDDGRQTSRLVSVWLQVRMWLGAEPLRTFSVQSQVC